MGHSLRRKVCKSQLVMNKEKGMKITCQATIIPADRVPDMEKRKTLNLLLLGAIGLPSTGMLLPYTYFYVPPGQPGTFYSVPWNKAENKFTCPCHGSQYNNQGKVVPGPAPLSLALAHADIDDGKVVFVPWTETDFRTGDAPWWS